MDNRVYVVPVNGDKFTTLHGQKGVVTILPNNKMPMVRSKHAELVIGTSAIIKRDTASQIREAACGMYCIDEEREVCKYTFKEIFDRFCRQRRLGDSDRSYKLNLLCKHLSYIYINSSLCRIIANVD